MKDKSIQLFIIIGITAFILQVIRNFLYVENSTTVERLSFTDRERSITELLPALEFTEDLKEKNKKDLVLLEQNEIIGIESKPNNIEEIPDQSPRFPIADGLSFLGPQGWQQADKKTLKDFEILLYGENNKTSNLKYLLSTVENDEDDYPYITIGYQYLGYDVLSRVTFQQWVIGVQETIDKRVSKLNSSDSENNNKLAIEIINYDEKRNELHLRSIYSFPDSGKLVGRECMKLSSNGVVKITLNALFDDEQKYSGALDYILDTLQKD